MKDCNCNKCNGDNHCAECRNKKKCGNPCGCAEPVFSVEAMPDDPTMLRFNVNGKSVWYDFGPVVKTGETCTTLNVNTYDRLLEYNGECGQQTITPRELGSIFHLADIGDVAAESIDDYGILNYRKKADCGEGCEGIDNGWVSTNPTEVGSQTLDYVLGSDSAGKMKSLMPPTDTATFSYLAWAAQNKAKWVKPTVKTTAPTDGNGKVWRPYIDPATGELVIVKENP